MDLEKEMIAEGSGEGELGVEEDESNRSLIGSNNRFVFEVLNGSGSGRWVVYVMMAAVEDPVSTELDEQSLPIVIHQTYHDE